MRIGIVGPFNPALIADKLEGRGKPSIDGAATAVNTLVHELFKDQRMWKKRRTRVIIAYYNKGMKLFNYIRNNIDVILLSLVLCINCIRVILGLGETTLILYGLYFLCLASIVICNGQNLTRFIRRNNT